MFHGKRASEVREGVFRWPVSVGAVGIYFTFGIVYIPRVNSLVSSSIVFIGCTLIAYTAHADESTLRLLADIPAGAAKWRVAPVGAVNAPAGVNIDIEPAEPCAQMPKDIAAFTGGEPSDEEGCAKVVENTAERAVVTHGCREDLRSKMVFTKVGPRHYRIRTTMLPISAMAGDVSQQLVNEIETMDEACDPQKLSANLDNAAATSVTMLANVCNSLEGEARKNCETAMASQKASTAEALKKLEGLKRTLPARCKRLVQERKAGLKRMAVAQTHKVAASIKSSFERTQVVFDLRYLGACEENTPNAYCEAKVQTAARLKKCANDRCRTMLQKHLETLNAKCAS